MPDDFVPSPTEKDIVNLGNSQSNPCKAGQAAAQLLPLFFARGEL